MPRFEIKVRHRPDIQAPIFSAPQMQEIGNFAVVVIKERNATGTDVLDEPAKPLQPKYAQRKIKQGKQPIRDIRLTGNTLGSLQVKDSNESHALVGIRGATPFRKALFNQNIDPWFGLSRRDDERVMSEKVRPIFHLNLSDLSKG